MRRAMTFADKFIKTFGISFDTFLEYRNDFDNEILDQPYTKFKTFKAEMYMPYHKDWGIESFELKSPNRIKAREIAIKYLGKRYRRDNNGRPIRTLKITRVMESEES